VKLTDRRGEVTAVNPSQTSAPDGEGESRPKSPEAGVRASPETALDLFSLGVVLYEVATGGAFRATAWRQTIAR